MTIEVRSAPVLSDGSEPAPPILEVRDIARRFRDTQALAGVSLGLTEGRVHALLGPNGAGKTTLLRILVGIVEPDSGAVLVRGLLREEMSRSIFTSLIGFVPSGDRSFYLRISGLENLIFFARLHNFGRREGKRRALDALEAVGLADAGRRPVGTYSHGMQKRLSVARALLVEPRILLVDEATHDLDPAGARRVRDLVTAAAERGTAILWTTQRVEEIRGFADKVTLLQAGQVRFTGSVDDLLAQADLRRHLLRLDLADHGVEGMLERARRALGDAARIQILRETQPVTFELVVSSDHSLGEALAMLHAAAITVIDCHSAHTDIEEAFITFTEGRR